MLDVVVDPTLWALSANSAVTFIVAVWLWVSVVGVGAVTVKIMFPSWTIKSSGFVSVPSPSKATVGSAKEAEILPSFTIVNVNTTLSPVGLK